MPRTLPAVKRRDLSVNEHRTQGVRQKAQRELKAVGLATGYFLVWLGTLMILKVLILEEYHVRFHKFSLVVVGALILAKVVLVLERVPLGSWVRRQPAAVDLLLRTTLYALGVVVVMLLEKAFEARHEYGGFGAALSKIFQHRDIPQVWADAICMSGALLSYNLLSLLRHQLGPGGLRRLLLSSPAESGSQVKVEANRLSVG